jgi:hypothetical protein
VQERGAEAADQHHERDRERAVDERGGHRHATERGERERDDETLCRAGERREDDDRERRVHRCPKPSGRDGTRRPSTLASGSRRCRAS